MAFAPPISSNQLSISRKPSAFGERTHTHRFLPKLGLWFFLAQNQPFLDGNKRTAADAMLAFLYLNGFTFRRSDMQILKKDQFFLWVSEHAYQLNEPEYSTVPELSFAFCCAPVGVSCTV